MKYYYALFKESAQAVEVEFPDLAGCVTFGSTWDEAIVNAEDALAGWLANAEKKFVSPPSKYAELTHLGGKLVPIPINEEIKNLYQPLKRINVILPAFIISQIDTRRKKIGLKRSTFLLKAAEEYLKTHSS